MPSLDDYLPRPGLSTPIVTVLDRGGACSKTSSARSCATSCRTDAAPTSCSRPAPPANGTASIIRAGKRSCESRRTNAAASRRESGARSRRGSESPRTPAPRRSPISSTQSTSRPTRPWSRRFRFATRAIAARFRQPRARCGLRAPRPDDSDLPLRQRRYCRARQIAPSSYPRRKTDEPAAVRARGQGDSRQSRARQLHARGVALQARRTSSRSMPATPI